MNLFDGLHLNDVAWSKRRAAKKGHSKYIKIYFYLRILKFFFLRLPTPLSAFEKCNKWKRTPRSAKKKHQNH